MATMGDKQRKTTKEGEKVSKIFVTPLSRWVWPRLHFVERRVRENEQEHETNSKAKDFSSLCSR